MKILLIHIYYTHKCSGASTMVYSLYDSLLRDGHEPFIFATDAKPYFNEKYPYIKYFPKNLNNWDTTGFWGIFKKLVKQIYNKEAADNLAKMLDEVKPDIAHIHSVWELSYSIIKPIKDRGIPIVFTAHDASIACPAIFAIGTNFCTQCRGLNTMPCTIKKCVRNKFFDSLYYTIRSFVQRILFSPNSVQTIITPSQAMTNYMMQFNIPKEKFIVINNSLPDKYLSMEACFSNNKYFLFAGGLFKQKGIKTLLSAFSDLPREIELHIAGDIPYSSDYEEFKNFIKINNLFNVKFLGPLSQKQLNEEYKNCISSIVPSEWFDNFPTVILESFALGKPSIGSKIGGIPEMIEHNKTGLLFEPGNVKQLKECILTYWNNAELVKEHGKNTYEKVRTQYTEEKYYNALMQVYEEVLSNAK